MQEVCVTSTGPTSGGAAVTGGQGSGDPVGDARGRGVAKERGRGERGWFRDRRGKRRGEPRGRHRHFGRESLRHGRRARDLAVSLAVVPAERDLAVAAADARAGRQCWPWPEARA